MKKTIIIFTGLLMSLLTTAQDTFVIKNVRLFDGETVKENVSVLVKNGMISKVITKKFKDKSMAVVDGDDKTLMPAMTNAHVHAWAPGSMKEAAKAGVLNLLDMHGVEQYQEMMRKFNDSTDYANFYAAGSAATAPGGHGTQFGFPAPTLSKPEEAEQFIKDRITGKADYIKIIVEPWKNTLSHETVKALISAAHKQERIAVVHISKVNDAYQVLNNNANGLVHIWWDKTLPEHQLKQLAKDKSFFVIPTLLTSIKAIAQMKLGSPNAQFLDDKTLKAEVKRLYDAGIPILAGTDPPNLQINYGDDLHKELKLISEAGVPNIDVLKSATSNTAIAFGLEKHGMIKEGYLANMVLINGNPLETIEDISNIESVWKQGKKVKLN